MSNEWDDVKRTAEEIELEIHLAGMDVRDRWRDLKPRLEQLLARSSKRASEAIDRELVSMRDALQRLRSDLAAKR